MVKERVLQSLGLCQRARKIIVGEQHALEEIKTKNARIVFLANDAGKNTTKRITDKTSFYEIELITSFSCDEISKAIGKRNCKVLAVTDANFAKMIKSQIVL